MSNRTSYQIPVITIKELETPNLVDLCDQLIQIVKDKFERINNAVCPSAISIVDENLFIYDEYGVISDIEDILHAFGLQFKKISLQGLKGKQYQVQDSMFELIALINGFNPVKELAQQIFKADDEFLKSIKTAINEGHITIEKTSEFSTLTSNKYIEEVLKASLIGKKVQSTKEEMFTETRYNGQIESRVKTGEISDEIEYQNAITKLSKTLVQYGAAHKKNMVAGTTATIESRAKKMGYTVQKKKVGKEVEIILVRSR
jgi:hypothetical protein